MNTIPALAEHLIYQYKKTEHLVRLMIQPTTINMTSAGNSCMF